MLYFIILELATSTISVEKIPYTHKRTQTNRHTAVQRETVAMHSQMEGNDEDSTQTRRSSLSLYTQSPFVCPRLDGINKGAETQEWLKVSV